MTKTVYFLPYSAEINEVISKIFRAIPCWTARNNINSKFFKLEVECRAEDVGFVEKTLAPFE